jgi:cyclopropane fatty-acyl-phospholipid synthase-like methyltransferase
MTVTIDFEENEVRALSELTGSLAGQRILEIGCGDGRLTWRYAAQAAHVVAIDPNPERIARAQQDLPSDLNDRVTFHAVGLQEFAAQDSPEVRQPFDLVLLAYSL